MMVGTLALTSLFLLSLVELRELSFDEREHNTCMVLIAKKLCLY